MYDLNNNKVWLLQSLLYLSYRSTQEQAQCAD